MQIMYQRLKGRIYKGCAVGKGATNIEFLVISDRLRGISVPNLVPKAYKCRQCLLYDPIPSNL